MVTVRGFPTAIRQDCRPYRRVRVLEVYEAAGWIWVGPATAVTSGRMLAVRPELGAEAGVFGRYGFARNRSPSKPVGAAGLASEHQRHSGPKETW